MHLDHSQKIERSIRGEQIEAYAPKDNTNEKHEREMET